MSADSLPPDHKEQIINECNKAEQWPREKMQQQDTLPKTSDPVFWSSDIKSKAEELKFYDLPYPFSFAEVYTFFICYPLILSKESNVMALLFSECVSGYWDPKVLKFYLTRVTTSKTLLISMNNSHKCRLFQVQTNIPKENVGKSSSSQGINFFPNGDKKNANLTLP